MDNYKEIMIGELNKGKCQICTGSYYLIIHHIDGNRKNNEKYNLICLCEGCHLKIHHGLSGKHYYISQEIKEKILYFREIWMKSKLNFLGNKRISERITYERIISSRKLRTFTSINKCHFCNRSRNLKYFLNKELYNDINKFINKEKLISISLPLCPIHYKKQSIKTNKLIKLQK